MKTIMIIGAGKAQVPLIEAAKRENYHTIVCDINPSAPGVALADEYCAVSTKDRLGLLKVAEKSHINGIVANSEYAMCDVAFIASRLGLIGNPESAVAALSSKSSFRAMQRRAGLFAPVFFTVDSPEAFSPTSLSFPILIKPDESSGSRGIAYIKDAGDISAINESISTCISISRNGKAIIEEYVPILPHAVIEGEIFLHNGHLLPEGLFLSLRSEKSPMIPMTYVFPLPAEEEQLAEITAALTAVFRAAGITHGEYNIEMAFTSGGEPFIFEINPRQGGNDLPQYVQAHCGIDCYRLLVTTSMGDEAYFNSLDPLHREHSNIIHHMLYPHATGLFKGVHISPILRQNVYALKNDVVPGTVITETSDASSCIGYVDMQFSDCGDQLQAGYHMEDLIQIEVSQV